MGSGLIIRDLNGSRVAPGSCGTCGDHSPRSRPPKRWLLGLVPVVSPSSCCPPRSPWSNRTPAQRTQTSFARLVKEAAGRLAGGGSESTGAQCARIITTVFVRSTRRNSHSMYVRFTQHKPCMCAFYNGSLGGRLRCRRAPAGAHLATERRRSLHLLGCSGNSMPPPP